MKTKRAWYFIDAYLCSLLLSVEYLAKITYSIFWFSFTVEVHAIKLSHRLV